jgi:oligoendopeptidase F
MESSQITIPTKNPRRFLPDQLNINSWDDIEPFFKNLNEREINNASDLENWMLDRSELEAVLEEDAGWRYIKMSIDTTNVELVNSYKFFVTDIQPKMAPYDNDFNKKLFDSPFLNELDEETYRIYVRGVKRELEIFREENIPLLSELQTESQQFGAISGAMTIDHNGEDMTMQKAGMFLKSTDREERKSVYTKVKNRRLTDADQLNELFSGLVKKRDMVARNAGFANYRDYKFAALGRFDYTPEDCYDFHESIEKEITPLVNQFNEDRKNKLGVENLHPWDLDVDAEGRSALKPFEAGSELINNSIDVFYKIRNYYGECLEVMREMGHLDLESKNGKSPGGYNYPLYEIGVPFIFMNSVGTQRDLVTMMHEGGHAIHSFLTRDLINTAFKSLPSEVAELASMSMELISMDHWDVFYSDPQELKRAKQEQLEKLLSILPWIAIVDKFQHWVYENPNHSVAERTEKWEEIYGSLSSSVIDWDGNEDGRANGWQRQLHLFEVPFYYIEYGMAQLGAIAVWRNYKQDPEKALDQYQAALSLGYTKSIAEIYETAGIQFDFSREYVKELTSFIKSELEKL